MVPHPTARQHFYAGTTAGVLSAAILYPIDLVKVRYQVYDKKGRAYRSLVSAFTTIAKTEGIQGLYQGLLPATMASAVSWGGYFYFYELSKHRKLGNRTSDEVAANQKLGTIDHLFSGVEAGSIMVFFTNPLWLLKTRLQLQGTEGDVGPVSKYKGPSDAVRVIWREEGLLGFYRGTVPALFLTSHGAVQFAAYEWMKRLFHNFTDKSGVDAAAGAHHHQPAYVSMLQGGTAKMIASTVTYPYQVVKSRLQQRDIPTVSEGGAVSLKKRYTGTVHCVSSIFRNEGVVGFFRGIVPNSLKVAPNAALTFVVYEECLKLLIASNIG